jgi:hypothetical protein
MSQQSSFVVYRGPSMLDASATIIAIVTLESSNTKTGPMAQLFIMPAFTAPHTAQQTGDDAAVCGDCAFRPLLVKAAREAGVPGAEDMRACYVKTFQGPRATWQANHDAPVMLDRTLAILRATEASLRLGAYGDPAALPESLIHTLSDAVSMRITGYTHQWRNPAFGFLRAYVMASCDAVTDYARAKAEGWRTFRVIQKRMLPVLAAREIECPSDKGVQCIDCLLCDGVQYGAADRRKDIAIHAH